MKKNRLKNKGFLKRAAKITILVIPFLFIVIFTNYSVDPGRLYFASRSDSIEIELVKILNQGHGAEPVDNVDDRLLKREYLSLMEDGKNTIVLGSSRGALVTTDMLRLEHGELFNSYVTGASLQDMIALCGIMYQNGTMPENLVIVVDPWILNDNNSDYRFQYSLGDVYYYYLTERLGIEVDRSIVNIRPLYRGDNDAGFFTLPSDVIVNLISITYFQASIQRVISGKWDSGTISAVDTEYGEFGLLRYDGSFSYPLDYRESDQEAVFHRTLQAQEGVIGLEDYYELESENKKLFIEWLTALNEDGVSVILVMPPLNNNIYTHLMNFQRYQNFFAVEDMLSEIADLTGAEIVGSYNPFAYGFTLEQFYDAYHLKPEGMARILEDMPNLN